MTEDLARRHDRPDRRGGPRRTRQREAIRRVLADAPGPLGPQEIHEAAGREVPDLGLATVYRALRRLEAEGWIAPVQVPGAGVRYERAGRHHHHHFQCEGCDRLFDLEGCAFAGTPGPDTPPGFVARRHEVVIFGRCPACATARGA